MQVEGCDLTPILSPKVHQFTSQTGDRKKKKQLVARDSDQITWLHRRASSVNTRTIKFQNCVQYLDRNHIFYL